MGHPDDDPADAAALAGYAEDLVAAVDATVAGWVVRCVQRVWETWAEQPLPADVRAAAAAAGAAARADVVPRLRALLGEDVADQRANPLAVLRRAVDHPTRVLAAAGVPPVVRDEHAQRLFPHDAYDLVPAAFADLDPSVHDPGIRWGAAKAHVLLARRRRAG